MKVLLVDGGDDFGGQQVHVLQLVAGLPRLGVTLGLVCADKTLAARATELGVPARLERFSSSFDFGTCRAIAKLANREGCVLVHTHGTRAGALGRIAARMAGVRSVHTAHLMIADIVLGTGALPGLKRKVYTGMESRLSRFSDLTICVSRELRRKYLALGVPEQKLTTIYNSVDLPDEPTDEAKAAARSELGVGQGAPAVGTVARLCLGKGIDCLLKAAEEIIRHRPNAVFLIAGDGPLRADLETQARDLALEEHFRLLGFRNDVHNVLLACDVFALPSLAEGHPLSILEAMAYARPVVGTRVSGITEAVEDGVTGILVPPHDHRALAEAIQQLLESPEDAGEMGRRGRLTVGQDFSPAGMLGSVRAAYEQIVGRTG